MTERLRKACLHVDSDGVWCEREAIGCAVTPDLGLCYLCEEHLADHSLEQIERFLHDDTLFNLEDYREADDPVLNPEARRRSGGSDKYTPEERWE